MKVELLNDDGEVVETVQTHNIELSDDLGFSVDYLREANDELPSEVTEIRVSVPASATEKERE